MKTNNQAQILDDLAILKNKITEMRIGLDQFLGVQEELTNISDKKIELLQLELNFYKKCCNSSLFTGAVLVKKLSDVESSLNILRGNISQEISNSEATVNALQERVASLRSDLDDWES